MKLDPINVNSSKAEQINRNEVVSSPNEANSHLVKIINNSGIVSIKPTSQISFVKLNNNTDSLDIEDLNTEIPQEPATIEESIKQPVDKTSGISLNGLIPQQTPPAPAPESPMMTLITSVFTGCCSKR